MTKYHLTPDGPRECRDTRGLCPYAKQGESHFNNLREAEDEFQSRLMKNYSMFHNMRKPLKGFSTFKKRENLLDRNSETYRKVSTMVSEMRKTKSQSRRKVLSRFSNEKVGKKEAPELYDLFKE